MDIATDRGHAVALEIADCGPPEIVRHVRHPSRSNGRFHAL